MRELSAILKKINSHIASSSTLLICLLASITIHAQVKRSNKGGSPPRVVDAQTTETTVAPPGAGFTVTMPSAYTSSRESSQIGEATVVVDKLQTKRPGLTYAVNYFTYPDSILALMDSANPDTPLNFARDRMLRVDPSMKILNERKFNMNGYPAIEIIYAARGRFQMVLRVYWALPHLYQVFVIREMKPPYRDDLSFLSSAGQRFVDSFQILSHGNPLNATRQYDPDSPPYLNEEDMIFVGGELLKLGISSEQMSLYLVQLSTRGIGLLTQSERTEFKEINDQAFSSLSLEESIEFGRIYQKYKDGQPFTQDETRTSTELMRRALKSLPRERLMRYQALYGKSVKAALRAKQR